MKYLWDTNILIHYIRQSNVWLAATAHLFNLTLVTMDNDFQHLDGHFLNILFV